MYFDKESVNKLNADYGEIESKYINLLDLFVGYKYKNNGSAEFGKHGFARRIKTMKRCIDNIYRICPVDIDKKLSSEDLSDLEINLQAFIVNVYGSLDNLAWLWVKEKGLKAKNGKELGRLKVGFSKKCKEVRVSFSAKFLEYLNSETHRKWFDNLEGFRHSLAHRIPLYVPPYVSNEEEVKKEQELDSLRLEALSKHQFDEFECLSDEIKSLGVFVPMMIHSFEEKSPQVMFQAQIIDDWNTVVQMSEYIMKELNQL